MKAAKISLPTGTENGYGYVDLGLSVKWATCNVGATKPEELGNYYAWGETQSKVHYDWDTYKWGTECALTKYNDDLDFGIVDNKTILDFKDDVARAAWGGQWRMPTDTQWKELIKQCRWILVIDNDVIKGYQVLSLNGNSIFLPAAGCYCSNELLCIGESGHYWASTFDPNSPDCVDTALCMDFSMNEYCYVMSEACRPYGLSVRPVF